MAPTPMAPPLNSATPIAPTSAPFHAGQGRRPEPLWLAWRWEAYQQRSLGYRKYRCVYGLTIAPRVQVGFERLADYLARAECSADEYFSALVAITLGSGGRFKPYPNNFGLPHYNTMVARHQKRKRDRLAGREESEQTVELRPRDLPAHLIPVHLASYPIPISKTGFLEDVRRYVALRRDYASLTEAQLWLHFTHEVGGGFLFFWQPFWASGMAAFCSGEQRAVIHALQSDATLATLARSYYDAAWEAVGGPTCLRMRLDQQQRRLKAFAGRRMLGAATAVSVRSIVHLTS